MSTQYGSTRSGIPAPSKTQVKFVGPPKQPSQPWSVREWIDAGCPVRTEEEKELCRRFIQDELAAVRVFEDEPYNMPSEVTKAASMFAASYITAHNILRGCDPSLPAVQTQWNKLRRWESVFHTGKIIYTEMKRDCSSQQAMGKLRRASRLQWTLNGQQPFMFLDHCMTNLGISDINDEPARSVNDRFMQYYNNAIQTSSQIPAPVYPPDYFEFDPSIPVDTNDSQGDLGFWQPETGNIPARPDGGQTSMQPHSAHPYQGMYDGQTWP